MSGRVLARVPDDETLDELVKQIASLAREHVDLRWLVRGRYLVLYTLADEHPSEPPASRKRGGKVSAASRRASTLRTAPAPEGKRATVPPAPTSPPMTPAPARLVCDWCARTDFRSRTELGNHRETEHPISRTPFTDLASRIDAGATVAGPRSPFQS